MTYFETSVKYLKYFKKSILVNSKCTNVTKMINNVVHKLDNWNKLNWCLCHSHFVHFKTNGTYNLV